MEIRYATDISEELGISKGLIYRYYRSKEDILIAVCDQLQPCFDKCASFPNPKDGMLLFGKRLLYYPYFEGYIPPLRILFTTIIRGDIEPEVVNNLVGKNFGALFKRGQEQGIFKEGDPEFFGSVYWNYLLGYLDNMPICKGDMTFQPDLEGVLALFEK